ncbi:uncharacterized protein BDV14DRAFT_179722 [Aspergillus stella-maris]|uniref:uncharacterized protein n=1 Tax=Aspergillus stella-maris TaxID=1810926 RepID=UPI003CCE060B
MSCPNLVILQLPSQPHHTSPWQQVNSSRVLSGLLALTPLNCTRSTPANAMRQSPTESSPTSPFHRRLMLPQAPRKVEDPAGPRNLPVILDLMLKPLFKTHQIELRFGQESNLVVCHYWRSAGELSMSRNRRPAFVSFAPLLPHLAAPP